MAVNRLPVPVWGVAFVLSLHAIGMWVIAALFVVDTATQPAHSIGGAIFLDVMIVLAAAAMTLVIIFFLRRAPATRSAIVVWQMTVIGIGIASAQGEVGRWDIAAALIIPATFVTIFMLFNREVSRHLSRDA